MINLEPYGTMILRHLNLLPWSTPSQHYPLTRMRYSSSHDLSASQRSHMGYHQKVNFSRIIPPFVALLVAVAPLLACLPNSAMTSAEMECCKKMAGNCEMGGGNHKCCDMTVNHSAPTAAIGQSSTPHLLAPCLLARITETETALPQFAETIHSSFIRIASSPPGPSTVLRI